MSPNAKKQLIGVAALLVAGGALAYVSFGGIEESLVYYWDAEELLAKGDVAVGPSIRLGGVVKSGSVDYNENTLALAFKVGISPDKGGPTVLVSASGAPPQMFREGIGVVVEGTYDGTLFTADRVLVKHSNEYRAPEAGERGDNLLDTLAAE